MAKLFGANWKTTASMIGATFMAGVTWLAGLSYDQGAIATIIPVQYKPLVMKLAGIATVILFAYNGIRQKDKAVTGGWKQQDLSGAPVKPGEQNLVDLTKQATPLDNR